MSRIGRLGTRRRRRGSTSSSSFELEGEEEAPGPERAGRDGSKKSPSGVPDHQRGRRRPAYPPACAAFLGDAVCAGQAAQARWRPSLLPTRRHRPAAAHLRPALHPGLYHQGRAAAAPGRRRHAVGRSAASGRWPIAATSWRSRSEPPAACREPTPCRTRGPGVLSRHRRAGSRTHDEAARGSTGCSVLRRARCCSVLIELQDLRRQLPA